MKNLLLLALFVFVSTCSFSQTYISLAPSLTNDAGTIPEKTNLAFEIGRQWDVFSLGIDVGKTSLSAIRGRDTTTYVEVRPNLNIFQQGKFTNTFTAGLGYIFNSRQGLMTELTSGIEYAMNAKIHLNIVFGQYYYSGRYDASSVTFFGLSFMHYFSPSASKPLINQKSQNK